ncbi:MAG: nucleoside hydrolase-like domain-containing protein [Cyclobacteriaceae bacterium]
MKHILNTHACFIIGTVAFCFFSCCQSNSDQDNPKPRIVISSDIGGTDPDDFQSMIHLLMYADLFDIEGLVSSPYGLGRKEHFLEMINLYEQDLAQLRKHSPELPDPQLLRNVCKQGETSEAPYKGYRSSTEGSDWIIQCAKKESDRPLWVLVWGGIEDLAQALHDAPEIKENIRVYWIGGPNKKWGVNAYAYIAENHPDLWMIEANATYRGWFMDELSPQKLKNDLYFDHYIRARGALGKEFKNHYDGKIKMGDTPSLAYLMNGNPNEPEGESWGGSFVPIDRSSRYVFRRNTTVNDTVVAYGVLEWIFDGPELKVPEDSVCFTIEIQGQVWPGFYLGNGQYGVRYSPKRPETGSYETFSRIQELNAQTGQYVSITPWPGKQSIDDYKLGTNWYGDRPDSDLFLGDQQGAKTVSRFREEFLMDWADRWQWLDE